MFLSFYLLTDTLKYFTKAQEEPNILPQENELIDTTDIALAYSDWRIENSCRCKFVWILLIANLLLLISLILDLFIYTDVLKLLLPFGHILNTQDVSVCI